MSGSDRSAAQTLTEREKLVALHNRWLRRASESKDGNEQLMLRRLASELREALYGS